MRPIDADALKRYINDCDVCNNCEEPKRACYFCPMSDCLTKDWERVIDEQPTVNAAEVSKILVWLSAYYETALRTLQGRYRPHEVISWLITDLNNNLLSVNGKEQ